MFGFLKKKLKEAVDKFTKKAEEEAEVVEEIPVEKEEVQAVEKEKEVSIPKKELPKEPVSKKPEEEQPVPKKEPPTVSQELEEPVEIPKPKEFIPTKPPLPKEIKVKPKDIPEVEPAEVKKPEPEEEMMSVEPVEKLEEPSKKKPVEKKGFFAKIFKKKPVETVPKQEVVVEEPKEEQKGILKKISEKVTNVSLSESKFNELFWELELAMLENNVAVEVIEKIKNDLRQDLTNKKMSRKGIDKKVIQSLRHSVEDLLNTEKINLLNEVKKKKPYIIVMVGINGSGKTTTLAKLIHMLKQHNLDCVVGASDTFRAAAIQQLEEHTNRLGVKLIKHDYGSDPAAVAFDAVEHAKAMNKDVVLIDTAGRLHSNQNLMQELEKVIRVVKPDLKIFVGESIAGNDVVEQVRLFNDKVGIDAIILAKADIDEKGGAAISVSYVTGKPILYLGIGQNYEDLAEFNKDLIIEQIGL